MGTAWCELRISTDMLKLHIKEAGDDADSPCAKGTLIEVARHAGVSYQLIGHLTSGRRRSCSKDSADRLAYALGKRLDEIFTLRVSPLAGRNDKPRRTTRQKVAA